MKNKKNCKRSRDQGDSCRCTSTHRGNLWQWKVRWNKKSISGETPDCAANKYIPVPRNTSSRAKTDQWHRFIRVVARSIPIDEPRLQVGSIVGGMLDTYVRAEEYRGTRRRIESALEQRWMAGNVLNYRLLITRSVCSRSNSPTLSSRVFRFKDAERSRCRLIEPPSVIHGSFVNPILKPFMKFLRYQTTTQEDAGGMLRNDIWKPKWHN